MYLLIKSNDNIIYTMYYYKKYQNKKHRYIYQCTYNFTSSSINNYFQAIHL